MLLLKGLHNLLVQVRVAGALSRLLREEEEVEAKLEGEVQGGKAGELLVLDVEGVEGVEIRLVAGEEEGLGEGEGSRPRTGASQSTTIRTSQRSFPVALLLCDTSALARR